MHPETTTTSEMSWNSYLTVYKNTAQEIKAREKYIQSNWAKEADCYLVRSRLFIGCPMGSEQPKRGQILPPLPKAPTCCRSSQGLQAPFPNSFPFSTPGAAEHSPQRWGSLRLRVPEMCNAAGESVSGELGVRPGVPCNGGGGACGV